VTQSLTQYYLSTWFEKQRRSGMASYLAQKLGSEYLTAEPFWIEWTVEKKITRIKLRRTEKSRYF